MVVKKVGLKKMTLRPGDLKKAREDFINEPNKKKEQKEDEFNLDNGSEKPWYDGDERVLKPMIIRFTEVDQKKLGYILSKTIHKSKHQFCIDLIRLGIEATLKEID